MKRWLPAFVLVSLLGGWNGDAVAQPDGAAPDAAPGVRDADLGLATPGWRPEMLDWRAVLQSATGYHLVEKPRRKPVDPTISGQGLEEVGNGWPAERFLEWQTRLDGGKTAHRPPNLVPDPGGIIARSRLERLKAVVPVYYGSEPRCTGTRLKDGRGRQALLLAAHCFFHPKHLKITGPVESWKGLAQPLRLVDDQRIEPHWIDEAFARCVHKRRELAPCVTGGLRDLALSDLPPGPDAAAWLPCQRPPEGRPTRIAFGYGEDERGKYGRLLLGEFPPLPLIGAKPDDRWALTLRARLAPGDSGGPVLTAEADRELHERVPEVCWVVSGYLASDSTVLSRFEPAWDLPDFTLLRR